MKNKGIFKLEVGNKVRSMHYITNGDLVYALTLSDSQKIVDINNDLPVQIIFDLKTGEKVNVDIKLVEDKKMVKEIFDKMLEEKNTHFKIYDERLVVLEIKV